MFKPAICSHTHTHTHTHAHPHAHAHTRTHIKYCFVDWQKRGMKRIGMELNKIMINSYHTKVLWFLTK